MPVVVLTGMRQTGKSTLLRQDEVVRDRRYVNLDDFASLEAARREPDHFLESEVPLTIDEAQKCPELLVAIKKKVDEKRKNGWFLLSGSANFSVLAGVMESLAGRAIYLTLHPFSRRELKGTASTTPFIQAFLETGRPPDTGPSVPLGPEEALAGGMPSVVLGEAPDPHFWFKGYEQTYLERDVRQLSQVGDLLAFRNLLSLAALRTGRILNIAELGRDARMNAVTIGRHLGIMEGGFVLSRLHPFLRSRAARLVKSPKLYLSDSGLAHHLSGGGASLGSRERDAIWETYAAQNLLSILATSLPEARLHYWCVQGRHEVDFVVESGGRCLALEWKSSERWEKRDLSGLRAFRDCTPECVAGALVYNGTQTVRLDDRIWAVPAAALLS